MSDETVRVDTEFDEEKFQELKDFIDDYKDVRRESKKFYGKKILGMAYRYMEEFKDREADVEDIITEK